jgi:hypothetical protein
MLAAVRPPVYAPTVVAAVLSQSACLVPVFVKDANVEGMGAAGGSTSAASEDMSSGTGASTTEASSDAGVLGSSGVTLATTTPMFDVGGSEYGEACSAASVACDDADIGFDHALGLNCAGGIQTVGPLMWSGSDLSRMVIDEKLGATDVFAAVDGSRRVLLSTGVAGHVLLTIEKIEADADCPNTQTCPSTDFPGEDLNALPPPIDPAPQKCKPNEAPPGTGDCSETIAEQWAIGGEPQVAYDYTELLTAEHPARAPGVYNDMFVAWLSSERYTGNFALDPQGDPIAAVTLDYPYKLEAMPVDCEPDCPDTPLREFGFEGHAGTPWWPAEIAVEPGDTIEVVFALFDVGDATVDSAVLLDGLRWLCAPPPSNQ